MTRADWRSADRCTGKKQHQFEIAYLKWQARIMRLQSCRASPTLARELLALADQYDQRINELLRMEPTSPIPAIQGA